MQGTEPQSEHRWLDQLIGDWTFEASSRMGPDQPELRTRGQEKVRSLGGFWVIAEGTGEMPTGGTHRSVMQIGFDPASGRYRGTWIGSMMPQLWIYDGEMNDGGTTLTLRCRGPAMAGDGTLADYEDIVELTKDGRRLFRSRTRGNEGAWNEFLHIEYRRAP